MRINAYLAQQLGISRRQADRIIQDTGRTTRVYHAGMTAEERDAAQDDFMSGRAEVVVATNAFGMGIDKANIRTVIHTALPASVEGYYQEIGRAGRDGLPSRAVLLHGFIDRRTHEWFLDRDYPDPSSAEDGRAGRARIAAAIASASRRLPSLLTWQQVSM